MAKIPDPSGTSRKADSELKRKVLEIVADVLRLEIDSQPGNLLRSETEGWDSVNHLRLALELESAFEITLSDEQWVGVSSLDEIIMLLTTLDVQVMKPSE